MAPTAGRLFRLYAGLAFLGAILPYAIFVPWMTEHGWAPLLFLRELFATRPATIFASDVLYAAAVFILFVAVEGRRLRMRHLWVPPFLVVTVGLCCALPVFLAMRERALARGGA